MGKGQTIEPLETQYPFYPLEWSQEMLYEICKSFGIPPKLTPPQYLTESNLKRIIHDSKRRRKSNT